MSEPKEQRGWWGQGQPVARVPDIVLEKRGLLPKQNPDRQRPDKDSERVASDEELPESGAGVGT